MFQFSMMILTVYCLILVISLLRAKRLYYFQVEVTYVRSEDDINVKGIWKFFRYIYPFLPLPFSQCPSLHQQMICQLGKQWIYKMNFFWKNNWTKFMTGIFFPVQQALFITDSAYIMWHAFGFFILPSSWSKENLQ